MVKAITVLWFLLIILPTVVLGADVPKAGGKLTIGMQSDNSTLNPFVRMVSTDELIRSHLYETLLDFDLNGKIVPALAESWTISKDGLTYTANLRRGVKFHNSAEMTAEDVKWSAEYAMSPANGATGFSNLKDVKSISAVDRYTIRFTLKAPTSSFINYLATIRSFPVVPKDSIPHGSKKATSFPPGTGPFRFKDWRSGIETVFIRHKEYWQKGFPYLDQLVFKPIADATVRLSGLRAGDLDMIERTPYPLVAKIKAGGMAGIKVTEARAAGFRRILFNVLEPPFNDPRLRLAVAYSIDKNQYLQGAFWGFGTPTDQRFVSESLWFVKIPERKRDPAKVKSLLQEAGVGSQFEVELLGQKGDEEEQQILEQQLATAGIKMKISLLEFGSYSQKQLKGEFQMILDGRRSHPDPDLIYPADFSCRDVKAGKANRAGNLAGYCNKDLDKIFNEAGKTNDQQHRYKLYAKAIPLFYSEAPEIPLAFVPRFYAHHESVKGFVTNPGGALNTTRFGMARVWLAR